jgi:hypothetical protein
MIGSTRRAASDRAAPSDPLREGTEARAADGRADVVDDGDDADGLGRQMMLRLQKCRIEILRSVAQKIERGHEHDHEDDDPPVAGDRAE